MVTGDARRWVDGGRVGPSCPAASPMCRRRVSESRPALRKLRVVHIVPELGVGGAERHVVKLMPALDPDRFEPAVICIGEPGALFPLLAAEGVPAVALHRTKRGALLALFDL